MNLADDPRATALLGLIANPEHRAWAAFILQSLVNLEEIDFGELEPMGVTGPRPLD